MTPLMLLSVVLSVAVLCLVSVTVRLQKAVFCLRKDLANRNTDLAALCRAAQQVDRRIAIHDLMMEELFERVANLESDDQTAYYSAIISGVQNGFDVDELVEQCSLTHDEAEV